MILNNHVEQIEVAWQEGYIPNICMSAIMNSFIPRHVGRLKLQPFKQTSYLTWNVNIILRRHKNYFNLNMEVWSSLAIQMHLYTYDSLAILISFATRTLYRTFQECKKMIRQWHLNCVAINSICWPINYGMLANASSVTNW